MPNKTKNRVTIQATTDEVKTWLVAGPNDTYFFNMHRLYAEEEITGSTTAPVIHLTQGDDGAWTLLDYNTTQLSENHLLKQLHRLTGWYLYNEYKELGVKNTLLCSDGGFYRIEGHAEAI